jgi:hypothetical protein
VIINDAIESTSKTSVHKPPSGSGSTKNNHQQRSQVTIRLNSLNNHRSSAALAPPPAPSASTRLVDHLLHPFNSLIQSFNSNSRFDHCCEKQKKTRANSISFK